MQIKIKAGTDLTSDERGDLGMLLRQFDTYAPTPRDPKTSLPFEGVLESGQVHPERFRFFNISNQNTYFIVYDDDGRCIASATAVVAVTSRPAQVTIEDVVVLPAMRNTGIGNTLMAAVVTGSRVRICTISSSSPAVPSVVNG